MPSFRTPDSHSISIHPSFVVAVDNYTSWKILFGYYFSLKMTIGFSFFPDSEHPSTTVKPVFLWPVVDTGMLSALLVSTVLETWNKLAKVCNLLLPVTWQLLAHSKSISPHESVTPTCTTNKCSKIHLLRQFFCLQTDHHGVNCTAALSLAHNLVFQCSFQCWKFCKAGMASALAF